MGLTQAVRNFQHIKKLRYFGAFFSGDGVIRTHEPVKAKRFRVVLVMTTSIRLPISSLKPEKSKQYD